MPRDNRAPPVKLYYRIGEVAELVGVEPHVLRYWESEFPTIRPQKSRSGQRVYSRRDVEKLLRVKDLLYAQRFTIAGARQRLRGPGGETVSAEASTQSAATDASRAQLAVTLVDQEPDSPEIQPSTDDARRAAAALRSTLLSVRCQLLELLDEVKPVAADDTTTGAPDGTSNGCRW